MLNNQNFMGLYILQTCVWYVHVCVFSLSLSPSFSFLSILVDLMYATSTPDHVCLAEPTRGGWLVPPSLCLPTYLSGPVRSGQMPADSLVLFVFFPLSFSLFSFSLMTGMDGQYLFPPFHQYFTPLPLSVCPPCTRTTLFS